MRILCLVCAGLVLVTLGIGCASVSTPVGTGATGTLSAPRAEQGGGASETQTVLAQRLFPTPAPATPTVEQPTGTTRESPTETTTAGTTTPTSAGNGEATGTVEVTRSPSPQGTAESGTLEPTEATPAPEGEEETATVEPNGETPTVEGAEGTPTIEDASGAEDGQDTQTAQLERGQEVYATECAECHDPGGVGPEPDADTLQNYPSAMALFNYVSRAMPNDAPGSLPEQEYWDVVAHMLAAQNLLPAETVVNEETAGEIRIGLGSAQTR